ncbi:DNase/tRNase domain of colicin-like bacteriocin [Bacillus sp. 491mf]|uniref:HNH endonuclease n=1 Tax=Bacillus sp. 491mf TaxID=1761755 RepID=UPI0008EFC403|nr:HNH endonuclease [Bacillus sp. 491mf]SFD38679.1 DNase/tRNase domain of colicin-like bacteriocin [Bacillus sp. 491mf]
MQILNNINFIDNTIDIIVCPFDILGFPIFKGYDVKLTMRLDKSLYIKPDDMQFKACTQMLKEAIGKGEIPKEIFTPKQLKEIKIGLLRIIKLLLREQGLVSRGSHESWTRDDIQNAGEFPGAFDYIMKNT